MKDNNEILYVHATGTPDDVNEVLKTLQPIVDKTGTPQVYRHKNAEVYILYPNKPPENQGRYYGSLKRLQERIMKDLGATSER